MRLLYKLETDCMFQIKYNIQITFIQNNIFLLDQEISQNKNEIGVFFM